MQSSTQAGSILIIGNNDLNNVDHAKDNIKTNGEHRKYSAFGVIQLYENYINGLLNGARKTYHDNGMIATDGDYKDGKKHGKYAEYSGLGILLVKESYDNGLLHGERKLYHFFDGKLKFNGEYKNDKGYGKHVEYSDTGILICENNYNNMERKEYYLNGQLKLKYNFDDDGKMHGSRVRWDEKGNVIEEYMYDHGTQKIRWQTSPGKLEDIIYEISPKVKIISIKGEDGIEHVVPDGVVYVWKACRGLKNRNLYVKLEVPADAKRLTVISYKKARISHGTVVEIIDDNKSRYGEAKSFVFPQTAQTYTVGEMVRADSFDENVNNDCSHGISVHYSMSECRQWFG